MDDPAVAHEVSYASAARKPPVAPRALRALCLLLILALSFGLARHGWFQMINEGPDFEYFYKAGAWLLQRGNLDQGYDVVDGRVEPRGTIAWYLPFVSRLMTLFALLPPLVAGHVWLLLNAVGLVVTLRLLGRHLSGLPPQDWAVTQLVPLGILLVYWSWEFRLNQINSFTLLLMAASFVHWQQGQRIVGGFWLGWAVLLKLTPGLLVIWFALKRQYRTVATALLTVVIAGPLADVVVFGPSAAADAYRSWIHGAVTTGSHRGLILTQQEMDWRNQGLGAVLCRWMHPTNYNTHFDNDPRHQTLFGAHEIMTLNVVSLPRRTVGLIVNIVVGLTLLMLIWLSRRPAGHLNTWQLRLEWALWMLVMLWLMPVMRRYHMIWALPALTVLGGAIHYSGRRNWWTWLALVCIGLSFVAQASMLSVRAEGSGAILASVAVLALPIVLMLRRLARDPTALPAPVYAPALTEPDADLKSPDRVPGTLPAHV